MGNDADLPLGDTPFDAEVTLEIEDRELAVQAEDVMVATALADEDSEALEQGIASVFGSIRAEEAANEDEAVEPTYVLLDELNRLWAQAA